MRRLGGPSARRAALGLAAVALAAVAWYLGSPLFIRTSANEAFPTTVPTAAAVAASGVPAPASTVPAVTVTPAAARTIASGELGYVDPIHNGKGQVLLIRTGDSVVLRFDNVAITNAPDVHVYLSRDTGGRWTEATSVYLGPLKATNGSFNYPVPPDTDLGALKSVVVWCRQFSVLVTWADLR